MEVEVEGKGRRRAGVRPLHGPKDILCTSHGPYLCSARMCFLVG